MISKKIEIYICIGYLLLSIQYSGSCLRLQTLTLYTDYDNGTTENYTSNQPDLVKVSKIVQRNELGSVCSQMGVWAFFTSKAYDDSSSFGYHPATSQWSCNDRRVSAYMSSYKSIRHLGNRDLDKSGISLYKEPFFATDELYFDGEALSLSTPFEMTSFGFTGADNWTLFSGFHFTGDGICLCSENYKSLNVNNDSNYESGTGSGTSGVTFEERLAFMVGSLRKGCYGSQVWLQNGEFVRPKQVFKNSLGQRYLDSLPALKLHPISNSATFFFAGQEINLPAPQKFDAFLTQKNSNWTIYTEPNFSGRYLCLNSRNRRLYEPFTSIGSIRQNCDHDHDKDKLNTGTDSQNINESHSTSAEPHITTDSTIDSTTEYLDSNSIEALFKSSSEISEFSTTNSRRESTTSSSEPYSPTEFSATNTWRGSVTSSPREITGFSTTNTSSESANEFSRSTTSSWRERVTATFSVSELSDSDEDDINRRSTDLFDTTTYSPSIYSSGASSNSRKPIEIQHGSTSRPRDGRNFPFPHGPKIDSNHREKEVDHDNENLIEHEPTSRNNSNQQLGKSGRINNSNESESTNNFRNDSSKNQTRSERISTADTNSIFFTAFIITLGLLILCMLLSIGLFLYFRSARKANLETLPHNPSPSPERNTSARSRTT